jgi:hypothetical protein
MLFLPAIALMVAACSDQPLTPPGGAATKTPARIEILSGQDQVAVVGDPLPADIKMRVVDAEGNPIGRLAIAYAVTSGSGVVQTDTVLTDDSGVASGRWILGPEPGDNLLEAQLVRQNSFWPRIIAIFRARGVRRAPADAAAALEIVSGQAQSGTVGKVLADPLVVRVVDGGGHPVSGQEVTYRVTEGGGTLSASKAVSDEKGDARVRWTLGGNPGRNALVASVAVSASRGSVASVTFTAEGKVAETTQPTPEPPPPSSNIVAECASPQAGWIWCDDFETDRIGKYFEYDNAGGSFARAGGVGIDGSQAMRARFARGQVNAGSLKLAFGRTPQSYFRAVDQGTQNYREVYWRFYVKNASNWSGGGGDKLTRAASMASSSTWAEAMIAHVWSGGSSHNYLVVDPTSGTDTQGNLKTTKYNDFDNLRWLGAQAGRTPIFASTHVGKWYCVEARARLNDAGQSNGVLEYWIDGQLEARREGMNWVGSFDAYGINVILLENYWNNGSPQAQERYIDNFVVSTRRIGCGSSEPGGPGPSEPAPTPVVTTVAVSPAQASITVGESATVSATVRDQDSRVMADKSVTWRSSNTGVARVTSTGQVSARIEAVAAGTATVTAEVDGKSAQVSVTVTQPSAPPPSDPSPTSSWLNVDFARYTSTADLMGHTDRNGGPFRSAEDLNSGQISLDNTTGYGSSTRSMRYTFPDRSGTSNRCGDYSIGRVVGLPENVKEVWVEVVAKFSDNFASRAPSSWGCTSNPDYKFLFGMVNPGSRFELKVGMNGSRLSAGYPGSEEDYRWGESAALWDGQWHRYRFHWKLSSDGAADGAVKVWIDGQLVYSKTGIRTTDNSGRAISSIWGIGLGRNMNQGPGQTQHVWWGSVKAWKTNPGW